MSTGRSRAKRLAIFNHKGGVGKTTLAYNISAELAALNRRVLLVDSDPQCNLTSYLLPDDVVDDLLDASDSAKGGTVWSALKPIVDGMGDVRPVAPLPSPVGGVDILPGDIRLSEFESELNEFWNQCVQRRTKGFRGMAALSRLASLVSPRSNADYILFDCGPNIGPLNRAILLGCDYLVVPLACDLFSVRALKTLGRTLSGWVQAWRTIAGLAPADVFALPGRPMFIGYIPQNFRMYRGQPAGPHRKYLSRVQRSIQSDIVGVLRREAPGTVPRAIGGLSLGGVKNFSSLVAESYQLGVPLANVRSGSAEQRKAAKDAFSQIARNIIRRTSGRP